jgi:O-antigen ligase
MATVTSETWTRSVVGVPARSQAVPLLRLFAVTLMVFPSYEVLKPAGANAYPAGIVGMLAFVAWGAATLLGVHDAQRHRHPVRAILCFFWLTTLISYVLIDRGVLSTLQSQSADRFLMQLADMTGVALIAAEGLHSLAEVRRVLRALIWGGAFCGFVAALQFWLSFDVTRYLRIPGFSVNTDVSASGLRDGITRVTGTGIHPIELGVMAGMLLPIAIYLAIYDTDRAAWKRWVPVALIAVAVPASVSRSSVVAAALSMGVLIVLMPIRQRLSALAAVPVAIAGAFVTAHGLIGTLTVYFGAGTGDASVAHRVGNWVYVEHLVRQAPWFGTGGGTYIPSDAVSSLHVLDDQYLHTAIELGLVGVLALGILLIAPMILALVARNHSRDPELRLLCAALAGAGLAAAVCSSFFDSLSFPLFYNVYALVIGLTGACWRFAREESRPAQAARAGRRPSASVLTTTTGVRAQGGQPWI